MKKTSPIKFCFAVFFLAGFVCWNHASAQTETAAPETAETKAAEPEVEKTLLQKLGCDACHRLESSAPVDKRLAPDLFFAGNKFQEEWLKKWLRKPTVLRPAGYVTDPGYLEGKPTIAVPHPKVKQRLVEPVTQALMEKIIPKFPTGKVPLEPLSKGKRFKIKIMFERDFGCNACHQSVNLAGQPRGGISGPTMLGAGDRLQVDWVYEWLKDAKRFEPHGRMPVFDLTDEERQNLARYVMWHQGVEGR